MIDPLALALRELRGSPDTHHAGWRDAEDADALHAILLRAGWFIAPVQPGDDLRLAVHLARIERAIARNPGLSGTDAAAAARAAVGHEPQREIDHLTMRAMQQHLAATRAVVPADALQRAATAGEAAA